MLKINKFQRDGFRIMRGIEMTVKLLNTGYSVTEIAVQLNEPESTIRSWIEFIKKSEERVNETQRRVDELRMKVSERI